MMRTSHHRISARVPDSAPALGLALGLTLAFTLLGGAGCRPMSEHVEDPRVGLNGGFEHVRDGLPVNWLVYTPATVPSGRFEVLLDREQRKEGERSLCFRVEACSSDGGRRSPGIATERPAEPGASYDLAFWIRSEGCAWVATYGGVDAFTAEYATVRSDDEPADGWQRVERRLTVPERYERLRLELSVRSPGTLWIDDVSVTRADRHEEGAGNSR